MTVHARAAFGFLAVVLYLAFAGWAMQRTTYDIWPAFLVAPVLAALTLPILFRTGKEDGPWVARLLLAGFAAKMLGTVVRYVFTFEVYEKADARSYDRAAEVLGPAFRAGAFNVGDMLGEAELVGTRFLEIVAGVAYAFHGPSQLSAFLAFSWLAFCGLYLLYRAFRIALPQDDHGRYALLLLFLPSVLYWPSSVGKDAWMLFGTGLASYGAARILCRRRLGLPVFMLGIAALSAVRPPIALLLTGALVAGYVARRPTQGSLPFTKPAVIAGLGLGFLLVFGQVQAYLGFDEINGATVQALIDYNLQQTTLGGSRFTPVPIRDPLDLPAGVASVLFRPLPFEAPNAQGLAAAVESMFLLALVVSGYRRWWRVGGRLRESPYLVFALAVLLGGIVILSSIANFGLLARQRVQVLPFLLVLLALAPPLPAPRPLRVAPPWTDRGGYFTPARPGLAHPSHQYYHPPTGGNQRGA